jgi:TusE/DsrC/DsvC family sulfur relay protein
MEKTYLDSIIKINDEGYLTDFTQWTREIGEEIAKEQEIEMTDKHWEVIDYIHD